MILIDAELAREQFALLDPDTAAMLMRAMEDDVRRCAAQLAAAARAGDDEAMRRARHSLRGLCGAFGADALDQAASGPLDNDGARDALIAMGEATIEAINALQ